MKIQKNLKGNISISRPSCGDDREYVRIQIEDDNSHIRFLDVEIGLEDFARGLTGLSGIPITFNSRGLEHVGMKRVTKPLTFHIPKGLGYSESRKYAEQHAQEFADEGWTAETYFGSKSSFTTDGMGRDFARTNQFKFVQAIGMGDEDGKLV